MTDQPALVLLVRQLQQELQNQRTEIQTLRTDLSASRNDIQSLQTQLLSQKTKPRLPDPPRFDGKPYTLRTWLPSIQAKLRSDQLSGADAFDYVWDRLEQPQQASVLHLRQSAEETQSWDPEVIFSFFQRLCHNPREQQEAMQRFTSVRQREDESLVAFLARFERLLYEASATTWPDASRIATLHRGLRTSLHQALENSNDSLFSLPYDDYIELVQLSDRRTRYAQSAQNLTQTRQFQPAQNLTQNPARKSTPALTPHPDPMDTDPVQAAAFDIIESISPPASPASARQSFRREHNLCLYCGSDNHWIGSCPERSHADSPATSPPTSPKPRTKTTARCPELSARYGQRSSEKT